MAGQADRLAAKLRAGVSRRVKAFTLAIARELKIAPPLGTPVQDGNARANWIASAGAPFSGSAMDKAAANAAAAQGTADIAAWSIGEGDLYVTNRTPYIRFLNNGSSKQSPALFVEAAIERARTKAMGGGFVGADQSAQDVASSGAEGVASSYSPFGGSDD